MIYKNYSLADIDERKVYLVFVSFYCDAEEIQKTIAYYKNKIKLDGYVIVSNNRNIIFPSDLNVTYGSNALLDMSGYHEGLEYVKAHYILLDDDILIFANDSIHYKHSIRLLVKSASLFIHNDKLPKHFYAGVLNKINGINKPDFHYFSTYFFIADFNTIDVGCKKLTAHLLHERKKIFFMINNLPLIKWTPRLNKFASYELYRLKRKCITLEFLFSSYAVNQGIFKPLPLDGFIKAMRFLIKVKNFLKKIKAMADAMK